MDFGTFFEWNWITMAAAVVLGLKALYKVFCWIYPDEIDLPRLIRDSEWLFNDISRLLERASYRRQIAESNKQTDEQIAETRKQIAENNKQTDQQIAKSNNQTNQLIDKTSQQIVESNNEINHRFDTIILMLAEELAANVIMNDGPLCLSPEGKEISVEIHAEEEAERYAKELLPRALDQEPLSIQEMCILYALCDYKPNAELYEKIQAVACERRLPYHKVLMVLAIVLRDKLLEEKKQAQAQD